MLLAFVMLVITTSVVMISTHEVCTSSRRRRRVRLLQNCRLAHAYSTSCIEVEYESPTTVVLNGHWQGVDALKSQGFLVTMEEKGVRGILMYIT